jgi:large subunit ribosomal protein L4
MLDKLRGETRKSMVILPEHDNNVYLSSRNLQSNKTTVLSDMNTYDLVNAGMLIFTESAAKMFNEDVAAAAEA